MTVIDDIDVVDQDVDADDTYVWSVAGEQSAPPETADTPATVLPPRPGPTTPPPMRRPIGQLSIRDVMVVVGAAGSALCTTLLLFGRLTPMSGKLAFVVVGFAIFLVTYALLVSMTENRTAVIDRVMSALLCSAAVIAGIALISVVTFTLWKGREALIRTNLYTQDMSEAGPLDPLTVGGIKHAIVGTLIIITLSLDHHRAARLGVCGVPDRDTWSVHRARPDGRHRDDGAARRSSPASSSSPRGC